MPSRRLEDRIRELCAKVVIAEETELENTISQLNAALREHTQRLRRLAFRKLANLGSGKTEKAGSPAQDKSRRLEERRTS